MSSQNQQYRYSCSPFAACSNASEQLKITTMPPKKADKAAFFDGVFNKRQADNFTTGKDEVAQEPAADRQKTRSNGASGRGIRCFVDPNPPRAQMSMCARELRKNEGRASHTPVASLLHTPPSSFARRYLMASSAPRPSSP